MGITRSVIQYDLSGNRLDRYDSIKEAQELYNCTHISSVCRGRRKQEKGYFWEYEYPKADDFFPPGVHLKKKKKRSGRRKRG